MIDLGTVRPGSTIRIPFSSFDKDDGSSVTMTNYAAADILVYKDGSTTERASTAGFTATTDFDSKTGKHLAVIDLADNTTAGFFNAGSEYLVAIDAVTVDGVTTGGWIARFLIGYPDANLNTTIASLSSQTSFTLTAGPAEDDALNGCVVAIHDIASAVQMGYAVVADYTGASKTVTLTAGVTFTAAAGDNISVFPPGNARWFAALLGTALPASQASVDTIDDLLDTEIGALTTELAKVPKSDSNVSWNATALAAIQGEATDALNAYDPPTRTEATSDKDEILTAVGDVPTNAELSTALAAADDAVLAAIAALNNLSQANVRSALGMASANLDTQLGDLPTAAENAAALLAAAVEGAITVVQSLRLHNAALGGKASGLETTEATYRNLADSADRIVATVDADGNRTAVTLTLT